jgi:ATP-dependent Clp protease ATP-binding subunit ClpA
MKNENFRSARIKVNAIAPSQWETSFLTYLNEKMVGQTQIKRMLLEAFVASHGLVQRPNQPLFTALCVAEQEVERHGPEYLALALHHDANAFVAINLDRIEGVEDFVGKYDAAQGEQHLLSDNALLLSRGDSELPVSIVVFNGIENSRRDVQEIVDHICRNGEVNLPSGQTVDFRDCVVFVNTTIAARKIARFNHVRMNSGAINEAAQKTVLEQLALSTDRQFINSFTVVASYDSVEVEALRKDMDEQTDAVRRMIEKNAIPLGKRLELVLDDAVRENLIGRAIESAMLLDDTLESGDPAVELARLLKAVIIPPVNQLCMRRGMLGDERMELTMEGDEIALYVQPLVDALESAEPGAASARGGKPNTFWLILRGETGMKESKEKFARFLKQSKTKVLSASQLAPCTYCTLVELTKEESYIFLRKANAEGFAVEFRFVKQGAINPRLN